MTDGDLGDLDMIRKTQKEKRTWVAAGAKNNLQKPSKRAAYFCVDPQPCLEQNPRK